MAGLLTPSAHQVLVRLPSVFILCLSCDITMMTDQLSRQHKTKRYCCNNCGSLRLKKVEAK